MIIIERFQLKLFRLFTLTQLDDTSLSNMMELGTNAPNFELIDTMSGITVTLVHMKSKVATVVFFICNHCPNVKHINDKMVEVANKYQKKKE